jgi:hypothetical protein
VRDSLKRVPRALRQAQEEGGGLVSARVCAAGRVSLRCAQDWTPAFAGDADFVRFLSRMCCAAGDLRERLCSTLRVDGQPAAGGPGFFLEMNVGLCLGQRVRPGFSVPITGSATSAHPEHRCDLGHDHHARKQSRLQQKLDERLAAEFPSLRSRSCHGAQYTVARASVGRRIRGFIFAVGPSHT